MRIRIGIIMLLAGLGAFTIAAQVYMLRAFLEMFNGNEMALGTVLGLWLLLSGLGAWLARIFVPKRGKICTTLVFLAILSVLPVVSVYFLSILKTTLMPYGTMAGLQEIILAALLVLLPVCLVSGYLFILLIYEFREQGEENAAGRAYAFESFGGMLGGALVNFLLLWYLDSFVALRTFFALFVMLILFYSFVRLKRSGFLLTLITTLVLAGILFMVPFKRMADEAVYQEQKIVADQETPYGRVTVTRNGEQLNYYSDGTLLFSSGNEIWNEESVHYALLQRPDPKAVLLIGGGISGAVNEILKYRPEQIDYVEVNPVIADMARNTLAPPVSVHRKDARAFLQPDGATYDIILVNVPEPVSLLLNRFFTVEFASLLKRHMTEHAVVSFSLPSTADYVSPESSLVNSVLYHTLKSRFQNVIIIPGTRNWYLASDSSLSLNIAEMADLRMPENVFVNSYYIDDRLLTDRAEFITRSLDPVVSINHDVHPVIYRHQLSVWLSQFGISWLPVAGAFVILFVGLLLLLNRTGAGLFTAGFTGASVEVMVILLLQIALGYVIGMAGVVIMVFMAGLTLGPWLARRLFPGNGEKALMILNACMMIIPFLLFGIMKLVESNTAGSLLLIVLMLSITLMVSIILAMMFTVAAVQSEGDPIHNASRYYASDLFGSALGAFLVPVIGMPLLGMGGTLLLLVLMNIITTILLKYGKA